MCLRGSVCVWLFFFCTLREQHNINWQHVDKLKDLKMVLKEHKCGNTRGRAKWGDLCQQVSWTIPWEPGNHARNWTCDSAFLKSQLFYSSCKEETLVAWELSTFKFKNDFWPFKVKFPRSRFFDCFVWTVIDKFENISQMFKCFGKLHCESIHLAWC